VSVFASILVPLDGSPDAAEALGCAAWVAGRLGARLHVLSAAPDELPAPAALRRLGVTEEHWPLVTLHQATGGPADAILSAVARHRVDLVVMAARGAGAHEAGAAAAGAPGRLLGTVARAVAERCPVPVLLLPPGHRQRLPWRRVLAPLSGEADADRALDLAVRLAEALDLQVSVAHAAAAGEQAMATRARYADALHHEYPHRLDELVERVLPAAGPGQVERIEDVALCRGDVAGEILEAIERRRISLLVVGWHGRFQRGRARVLKQLLRGVTVPVLLVQGGARPPIRLRVGDELD
jgi:nucleotide-binding universal stress UspA family protein